MEAAIPLLLALLACTPKTAPEDRAFEEAKLVVAAFLAGEAEPQPLPPELQSVARAQAYMGEYVWEMYAATAAARAAMEPHLAEDPRYSGTVIALPAPSTETCCFDVHFLARVEGELRPWVSARAGWTATTPVEHAAAEALPEPGPADPELAARASLLARAGELEGERLVVPMRDLTGDASAEDAWVYAVPSAAEDRVAVGLHARFFASAEAEPAAVRLGLADKDWARADIDPAVGLFLEAEGRAPSEAHIFASRRYDLPLWVALDTGLWRVEGHGVGLYGTKAR